VQPIQSDEALRDPVSEQILLHAAVRPRLHDLPDRPAARVLEHRVQIKVVLEAANQEGDVGPPFARRSNEDGAFVEGRHLLRHAMRLDAFADEKGRTPRMRAAKTLLTDLRTSSVGLGAAVHFTRVTAL
jgi:hypothetical protein